MTEAGLNGIISEQEYHVKNDRFPPAKLAQDLDQFFSKIPKDTRYHIELRTEPYLADPVFEVLKEAWGRVGFFPLDLAAAATEAVCLSERRGG